tara:strand:- start:528 stop:1004 length:477 start_codon:yes stop_codon:yes gene_type:complete
MPYIEAKSTTIRNIFTRKRTASVSKAVAMKVNSLYLFTYAGKKLNQRRPFILCMGQKTAKGTGTHLIEGCNLNYLNEVQARVLEKLLGITKKFAGGQFMAGGGRAEAGGTAVDVFALMSAEDIATELSKYGDYKTFPLEQIYRTYDSKRISDIQQVVM